MENQKRYNHVITEFYLAIALKFCQNFRKEQRGCERRTGRVDGQKRAFDNV